jgi:hypothetical protein
VTSGQFARVKGLDWPFLSICAAFVIWCCIFIQRTSFRVHGALHFTLFDDAMVSMRYARNLADGHGLVWNAGGERVEGYTNPLWTVWMAFLHLLPVSEAMLPLLVMLTSMVLLLVNLYVVYRVASSLELSRIACLAAVVLTAGFYPLSYWALRGMEVGALALLIDLAVLIVLRLRVRPFETRDVVMLCVVIGFALTVRIDALLPCVLIAGFAWWFSRRGRVLLATAATIAGVTLAMTLARIAYYGDPLPNTYYLKATGVSMQQRLEAGTDGLRNLLPGASATSTLLLVAVFAVVALWPRARQLDGARVLLATIVLGQIVYSVYVGGDAWENMGYANRYVTVAAPLLFVLAAGGLERFVGYLRARVDNPPKHLAVVATGAVTLILLISVNGGPFRIWMHRNAELATADAFGAELGICERSATDDDAVIAVYLAGNGPYYSHRTSIDMLGKSDAYIAHLSVPTTAKYRPGHNKSDAEYSIKKLQPAVVEGGIFPWQRPPDQATQYAFALWDYQLFRNGLALRNGTPRADEKQIAAIKRQSSQTKLIAPC